MTTDEAKDIAKRTIHMDPKTDADHALLVLLEALENTEAENIALLTESSLDLKQIDALRKERDEAREKILAFQDAAQADRSLRILLEAVAAAARKVAKQHGIPSVASIADLRAALDGLKEKP